MSGQVTVCGLVPVRSIPFKVVCLLGMDDKAFSRVGVQASFDKIAAKPARGDTGYRKLARM